MPDHQLLQLDNCRCTCQLCGWTWKSLPRSTCPGVRRYEWNQAPEHLKTERQLRALRLKPTGSIQGCLFRRKGWLWLYDERETSARPPATPAQLAALEKARAARTCQQCGSVETHRLREGLCHICRCRTAAITWAKQVLTRNDWAILDTETTGLEYDAEIVQLGVLALDGSVLLDTLVKPVGPMGATDIHGLTADDVADAPGFARVFEELDRALQGRDLLLIYNSAFDRRLIQQSAAACERVIPFDWWQTHRFDCVMEWYAQFVGARRVFDHSFRWQPLPAGDHSAIGDCRATWRLIQHMAAADIVGVHDPATASFQPEVIA